MKITMKNFNVTVNMSASIKGSFDEIPNQKSELSETHMKDGDITGNVGLGFSIEEMTADITPEEMSEALKSIVEMARTELDGRLQKNHMLLERDRMNLEKEKASFAAKNLKNE